MSRDDKEDADGVKQVIERIKSSCTPALLVLLVLAAVWVLSLTGRTESSGMTQLEARISRTLSQTEGAGKVKVVIRTVKQSQQSKSLSLYGSGAEEIPCGAVAAAEGANDPLVRMKLTQALCALLGLHASQVEVISMNEGA